MTKTVPIIEDDPATAGFLRSGSADNLVKPVAMTELIARLEVLHRRRTAPSSIVTRLTCADLIPDLRAERDGQLLLLQPRCLAFTITTPQPRSPDNVPLDQACRRHGGGATDRHRRDGTDAASA